MYSCNSDYLRKMFDFSENLEGFQISFVDKEIEIFYLTENHKRDLGKSKSYFLLIFFGYILALILSIVLHKSMTRTSYIIIICLIVEVFLYRLSLYFKERYLLYRIIKKIRFFLIYLSIMLLIMFPVSKDKTQIIRDIYMFFAYINVLFTYYVEFNYLVIIILPLLNSFLIIFVQFYEEYEDYFLIHEFIFNIFFYYAVFIIKRYEFLLNKKLFFEVFKNQQYINYIKQLIDVINTHVISINKEEVLFMNNLAAKFFEKNSISLENNLSNSGKVPLASDNSCERTIRNDKVYTFFKTLKMNTSESVMDSSNGKSLLEILLNFFTEDNINSHNFTRLGYFNDEKSQYSFEIYARNLKFKQHVIEILLYDISDIRQAEQIKVESIFKKRVLAKIAHEFKTPLLTIISLINRINQFQEVSLDQNITTNLYHIENLSNYTVTLIGDITQYASDSLNMKLFKKEIGIKNIVEFSYNVLDTLIKCNEHKMNSIQTKLIIKEGVENIRIITDENRLKQILLNFVSNAFKFTINGFIKIKAKLMPNDNMLEISVKDTGLGIKEDKHFLVFQEFTQFNSSNEYNSKGSGLGLSICKQISNVLRHKIGFVSKYGKGSKFYIRIRCKIADESNKNNISLSNDEGRPVLSNVDLLKNNSLRSAAVQKIQPIMDEYQNSVCQLKGELDDSIITLTKKFNLFKDKEMDVMIYNKDIEAIPSPNLQLIEEVNEINRESNIVIIDDHKLIRENTINLVKSVLSLLNMSSNFTLIEASDGIELLNIIRLDKYKRIKCILIDENMEYLNGSETISIIRRLENEGKIGKYFIVSITGFDDEYSKDKLEKAGVDKIIAKPCTKSDLKNIFNKLK